MLTLAIILFLIFTALLLIFTIRVHSGRQPTLRRIAAFTALETFSSRATEAGRPLHVSLGVGTVADATTSDSLAGLTILKYLAEQSVVTGVYPTASVADPTMLLFAQNTLQTTYPNNPEENEAAYRHIRWIAPQPAAYAAGVMSFLNIDHVEANVMVGKFGDEYLLMGEAAARQGISHIGGASDPNTLPFVYVSAQEALLGEEIYAAGAYLQKRPTHIGSLLAQDTMRWLVALVILGGIALTSLQG